MNFRQKYGLLIWGILIGVVYGVITRLVFGEKSSLVSITYLFIVPLVLGIIPLIFTNEEKLESYKNIIFIPWLTIGSFFFMLFVGRMEDLICLFILAFPFLILGTLSAFIYRLVRINKNKTKTLLSVLVFPFVFSTIEESIKSPSQVISIESDLIINASSKDVWRNIIEVKTINKEEYNAGLFHILGIPRPISAVVDKKELGGNRIGNFEGGLIFNEVITQFKPNKLVSFDVKVDSNSIRNKIFDQHVLKGNYFNFVDAKYEIVNIGVNKVKLKLSSNYQLTTKINFYGKFWGDIILKDFQNRLLEVIKNRCEKNK